MQMFRQPCFFSAGMSIFRKQQLISKHTLTYDVTLLQKVYLQHGGGNCCQQNDVTVTRRISSND